MLLFPNFLLFQVTGFELLDLQVMNGLLLFYNSSVSGTEMCCLCSPGDCWCFPPGLVTLEVLCFFSDWALTFSFKPWYVACSLDNFLFSCFPVSYQWAALCLAFRRFSVYLDFSEEISCRSEHICFLSVGTSEVEPQQELGASGVIPTVWVGEKKVSKRNISLLIPRSFAAAVFFFRCLVSNAGTFMLLSSMPDNRDNIFGHNSFSTENLSLCMTSAKSRTSPLVIFCGGTFVA